MPEAAAARRAKHPRRPAESASPPRYLGLSRLGQQQSSFKTAPELRHTPFELVQSFCWRQNASREACDVHAAAVSPWLEENDVCPAQSRLRA